jgi:hypothetical protein
VQKASTEVAVEFKSIKESAVLAGKYVETGTMKRLIDAAIEKHVIKEGSIKPSKIVSRVKRDNLLGEAKQKQSPLRDLEPLLLQWCLKMARIGMALTFPNVVGLAKELIADTSSKKLLIEFKKKRGLQTKHGEELLLGKSWYQGFMNRNKPTLRRGCCKVKDIKRRSWCTFEHFLNMYNGVYEAMVEAKIAETVTSEIMYDENGDETDDVTKMYGRPTKYKLTRPAKLLFVDETGCNTNQKDDGCNGGELFVLPTDGLEFGVWSCWSHYQH